MTNKQGLSCLKFFGCFLCTKNRKKEVDLQEGVPFILREAVVSTVIGKLRFFALNECCYIAWYATK